MDPAAEREASWVNVEVVYALAKRQVLRAVRLPAGATIRQAIERSGILSEFSEIDLAIARVGVFGELRDLRDRVRDGDRIEIYRPLRADPKEARRARARRR